MKAAIFITCLIVAGGIGGGLIDAMPLSSLGHSIAFAGLGAVAVTISIIFWRHHDKALYR